MKKCDESKKKFRKGCNNNRREKKNMHLPSQLKN